MMNFDLKVMLVVALIMDGISSRLEKRLSEVSLVTMKLPKQFIIITQ